ncbi:MAG: hypothetical protein HY928_16915 [Elusimicrobia bacterium]|nr:hypothetical protein [Elusimicrobiota bacterium]
MPDKRPLRLPSWVVMVATIGGAVVMVPTAFIVYMRGGYTDKGTMQVLGIMLVPMLPFIVASLWKGLDMPDDVPPMQVDRSRELVVGERGVHPASNLSPEGAALAMAAVGGLAVPALWIHFDLGWWVFAAGALCLGGVAAAAWCHIRRVNRDEED